MGHAPKKSATLVTLSVLTMMALARGTAQAQALNCAFPMDFGTVVNCAGTGTIKIPTEGGAAVVTGCVQASPGGVSRGSCTVSQTDLPLRPIQVSVTSTSFNISSGGDNMVVDDFNLMTNNGGPVVTTTALAATIDIGSTLNVGASQPSGSYSGTVNITAILQ